MSRDATELAGTIKALAREAGFARASVAPAGPVEQGAGLRPWLDDGCCAGLAFMRANLDKRLDVRKLHEGAHSVICLAVSYAPAPDDPAPAADAFIARYARGRDYHAVLKKRCHDLMGRIAVIEPMFRGRAFCDTAPLMERSLAAASGLGWIGRNGCLIVPGLGSYVVLAEIVSNLDLPSDPPLENRCSRCGLCVEACPTRAISERQGAPCVDCRRCLSYLTIEHRGPIDPDLRPPIGGRLFGCDTCQECCPQNRGVAAGDPELRAAGPGPGLRQVLSWTPEQWEAATAGAALRRASHEMILRNAILAAGNRGARSYQEPLAALAAANPSWAELVRWVQSREELSDS